MSTSDPSLTPRGGFALVLTTGLVLVLLGALTGCVSPYRAISLEKEDPAHMRENVQEEDSPRGFMVAATLVASSEEARELFHHDLPESGVVPVILHLENRGEHTVRIHRDTVRLVLEDEHGTRLLPLAPRTLIRNSQLSAWRAFIWLPLIIPYLIDHERVANFNFEVARDYRQKSLPSFLRIAPDDNPFSRVLFFKVSEEEREYLLRPTSLDVPVEIESNPGAETTTIGRGALISVGMHR